MIWTRSRINAGQRIFEVPSVLTSRYALIALLLGIPLVFMTLVPVGFLVVSSLQINRPAAPTEWGLSGWQHAFSHPAVPEALGNTFKLAFAKIVINTSLAIFFAWAIARTDIPAKAFVEFVLWLGFFLPPLPMAMGWILLLDPRNGLLNSFITSHLPISSGPFNIFSFWGIVWAQLAFGTSVRFILLTPAFRAIDATYEEAARMSGSTTLGTLFRVTIPLLAPAILASAALGFIKSLESFELELILGGPADIRVYSTLVYQFLQQDPARFDLATALSVFFLAAILVLVWLQRALLGSRHYISFGGRGYSGRLIPLGRWRWAMLGTCLLFVIVMIGLPLSLMIMGTFMKLFGFFQLAEPWTVRHWVQAVDDPVFLRSLGNTLGLAGGAALGGTMLYVLFSYALVRFRNRLPGHGFLDFLSWLPWAVPGVLLSLALLWTFLNAGPAFRALYGTIYLLIFAIIINNVPLGTQMLKAGVMQIDEELEESARVSGASWQQMLRNIICPLLTPAMLSVGLIVFVSAVRDVPNVVFLATAQSRTLSLLMIDFLAADSLERAVVVGVIMTLFVIIAALVGRILLGKRLTPGGEWV